MNSNNCLNCNNNVTNNFCAECGQKNTTRRYDWWHVFEKEGLGLIINTDKGIFYTAKELLTNPGNSVRNYLAGKRVKHYNYLSFLLVCVGVSYFIGSYVRLSYSDILKQSGEIHNYFEAWVSENPKLFIVITIPIFSIFSMQWLEKAKYNISEHIVLNTYRAGGEILLGLPFIFSCFLDLSKNTLLIIYIISSIIIIFYNLFFYYQLFSPFYENKISLVIKCVVVSFSVIILSGVVFGFIEYYK